MYNQAAYAWEILYHKNKTDRSACTLVMAFKYSYLLVENFCFSNFIYYKFNFCRYRRKIMIQKMFFLLHFAFNQTSRRKKSLLNIEGLLVEIYDSMTTIFFLLGRYFKVFK